MNASDEDDLRRLQEHYAQGLERERLIGALGTVEFERTKEEIARVLPPPSAVVADIGGGPGRYAVWLAEQGYSVIHRDIVLQHAKELRETMKRARLKIDTAVADARELDLADSSVDAVLLLGPLYHLTRRDDRLTALREARRIVVPGGPIFVAAISRWAARLEAVLVQRFYQRFGVDRILAELDITERTGELRPIEAGSFVGYCHRPEQLYREIADAGLDALDLVGLEGLSFALADLDERLAADDDREVVFACARRTSRIRELLGMSPHLLGIARRPH